MIWYRWANGMICICKQIKDFLAAFNSISHNKVVGSQAAQFYCMLPMVPVLLQHQNGCQGTADYHWGLLRRRGQVPLPQISKVSHIGSVAILELAQNQEHLCSTRKPHRHVQDMVELTSAGPILFPTLPCLLLTSHYLPASFPLSSPVPESLLPTSTTPIQCSTHFYHTHSMAVWASTKPWSNGAEPALDQHQLVLLLHQHWTSDGR